MGAAAETERACDHAKAEAAQAERQVEARRAALCRPGRAVAAAAADEAAASRALADLDKARKIVEEAEAACGTNPGDAGLARLRAALAEAASVVATAASDDGAAPPDFFAVYASDTVPEEPVPPAPSRGCGASAGCGYSTFSARTVVWITFGQASRAVVAAWHRPSATLYWTGFSSIFFTLVVHGRQDLVALAVPALNTQKLCFAN